MVFPFSKLKNTVIKGTMVLTITGIATPLIGFYNTIFLADLIGAKELGIYQLIFPLYMLTFAISTQGFQLALTKLISHYRARDHIQTMHSFFKSAFYISFSIAIMITILMYQFSPWICIHILHSTDCIPCIRIISLCVPIISIKGCIYGYLLGLERSDIAGAAQLIEQAAKILGLMFMSTYIIKTATYDAAFASWGIIIGESVSCVFCIFAFFNIILKERNFVHDSYNRLPDPLLQRTVYRLLLKDGIPLTFSRFGVTGLQSMESILIPAMLMFFYHNKDTSLELYGIFTGMAFPFIMFPATITNSLSIMLLPVVSSANATLDYSYVKHLAEKSLYFCLIIGIFSTFVFFIFGMDIGVLIFHSEQTGRYLFMLSFLCPFIYIATTMSSILNGLGMASSNLFYFIIATGIRIVFIIFFIPHFGMQGYLWGLLASYLFLTAMSCFSIHKKIKFHFNVEESILFPCFIAIILGVATYYVYHHLLTMPATLFLLFLVICVYGGLYLALLSLPSLVNRHRDDEVTEP